ncbi:hypothetical protein GCM10009127_24220 [Alteraurantiacibacter aestuarii]
MVPNPVALLKSATKEQTMARKIILALTVSVLALTATACNTVRGAGQDLESVANDVDEAI